MPKRSSKKTPRDINQLAAFIVEQSTGEPATKPEDANKNPAAVALGRLGGFGLFAALSDDDGKTWPVRKLLTPGGPERTVNGIDRVEFTLSDTMAEPCGYLAACQTRDGAIQLITSRNHYVFNLAWLKTPPPSSGK